MPARIRLLTVVVPFLTLLSSCYEWKEIELPHVVEYDSVRVTTVDSGRFDLYGPVFTGDTLLGSLDAEWRPPATRVAVPADEIVDLRGFRKSPVAPYALVLLAGALVGVLLIVSMPET